MLISLHIENIAVIRVLDLDFERGFTVLTGETGAGKSIIIDAIHLLLGGKPSRDLIRSGEESAMVSAIFSEISRENLEVLSSLGIRPDEDGLLMVQRTVTVDGRSKTRVNGRQIPVSLQREAMDCLLTIHGQHENQMLLRPQSHLEYLDRYADDGVLLEAYRAAYDEMQKIRAEIVALSRDEREKARRIEQLKYQIADIDGAHLKPGEEEALEGERTRVKNIEKLTKHSKTVYRALYRNEKGISAAELIGRAALSLEQLGEVLPELAGYVETLNTYRSELEDIAMRTLQAAGGDIENPTAVLDRIESRLDVISKMERKYGLTIDEVLTFRERAKAELDEIEHADERIEECKAAYRRAHAAAVEAAAALTECRRRAAASLDEKMTGELEFLDMGKVRFHVSVEPENLSARGGDAVAFLISTNPGEPLKPLDRIASGGELSRLMLAVKSVLADRESTETLIFDEIDTGISGRTSQRIGIKLAQTASCAQVLCVTHSAQIAAMADTHFFISKHEIGGRTETSVTVLDREGRIGELARIMGGAEITESLRNTAAELLDSSRELAEQHQAFSK